MLIEIGLCRAESIKRFRQDRPVRVGRDYFLIRDDRVRFIGGEIQTLGLIIRRVGRERTLRELGGDIRELGGGGLEVIR